jgi:6-pyruvoyl-tetrahydropterin synthase
MRDSSQLQVNRQFQFSASHAEKLPAARSSGGRAAWPFTVVHRHDMAAKNYSQAGARVEANSFVT